MGVICNCLLGAYHEHYVIRSDPLIVYLAQLIQLENQLWATAKNI